MPVTGGIVPSSGVIYDQLAAVTRRAFIPSLIVQIYKANPTLALLLRNAQRAAGGMSQITAPIQGSSLVNFAWTGYDGAFQQPTEQAAIQNAQFNLKLGVVPIPFLGMQGLIQSTETIVPILKATMADAKTVMLQSFSSALYTNNTANPLAFDSLYMAYDDGTNVSSYGGISRTATPVWASTLITSAGGILTRTSFIKKIVQTAALAGGEAPDIVILSMSDWTTLMTDYMTSEQFHTTPNSRYGADDLINAGFRGLTLGDTTVFGDLFCPVGTAYILNSRYLAMYLSEDAPFAFSGWYSTIPNNQIGNVGVIITAADVVSLKPKSGMRIEGVTGGAF